MKGTFVTRLVVLMVLVVMLVSACAQPTPVPAQPTAAPQPAAAEPTKAPEPSQAAEPTQAPEPTRRLSRPLCRRPLSQVASFSRTPVRSAPWMPRNLVRLDPLAHQSALRLPDLA